MEVIINGMVYVPKEKSKSEAMKEKYESGDYICLFRQKNIYIWNICYHPQNISWFNSFEYKLIHKKHADILDAYLKDNSVEIEYEYHIEDKLQWHNINCNWLSVYDKDINYRLKPKEEYPKFFCDEHSNIFKITNNTGFCEAVLLETSENINNVFELPSTIKSIPYNKERGLYHKQPVWCWDKYITISRAICFYDAIEDMVFEQYSNNGKITRSSFGNIEAITPEQLKTMPFIFEMYKQLED